MFRCLPRWLTTIVVTGTSSHRTGSPSTVTRVKRISEIRDGPTTRSTFSPSK